MLSFEIPKCCLQQPARYSFKNDRIMFPLDYSALADLAYCRSLRHLQLNDNPITSVHNYKTYIIAMLPMLEELNNEIVSAEDHQHSINEACKHNSYLGQVYLQLVHQLRAAHWRHVLLYLRPVIASNWSFVTFNYFCSRQDRECLTVSYKKDIERITNEQQMLDIKRRHFDQVKELDDHHFHEHTTYSASKHQQLFVCNEQYTKLQLQYLRHHACITIQVWWKTARRRRNQLRTRNTELHGMHTCLWEQPNPSQRHRSFNVRGEERKATKGESSSNKTRGLH